MHVATPTFITDAQLADVSVAVETFHTDLLDYYSNAIRQGPHTTKIYHVGSPLGTPPIRSAEWMFVNGPSQGQKPLPNEVACCLTYHAERVPPPVYPQSWRGRMYIGPLNVLTLPVAGGTDGGRPVASFRQAIINSAVKMSTAINATGAKWVIYSKKQGQIYPVFSVGCDDAWDTQRSRGLRPTQFVATPAGGGGPPGPVG